MNISPIDNEIIWWLMCPQEAFGQATLGQMPTSVFIDDSSVQKNLFGVAAGDAI